MSVGTASTPLYQSTPPTVTNSQSGLVGGIPSSVNDSGVGVVGGVPNMGGAGGASLPNNTPNSHAQQNYVTESQVLDKKRLGELVKEVDPAEQLDEDVEDILLQIADDFIEQTVSQACSIAKHRKAHSIEVRDVQLVLERNWNMWIPGFGTEELRQYKKSATGEAHKQRMAVIRKALKKY